MRIRGVLVLLLTLTVVLGAMSFVSLSLTGKVVEAGEQEAVRGNSDNPALENSFSETPEITSDADALNLVPIEGFALTAPAVSVVELAWRQPNDAAKIVIWRAFAEAGPWFIHTVVPAEQGRYIDTDLEEMQAYYYRVQGFVDNDLSPLSEVLSVVVTYDEDVVVVSDSDNELFENEQSYLDDTLLSDEYERRLKLANQKAYCDILSLAGGALLDADVRALADCGGIARILGFGETNGNDEQPATSEKTITEGSGGKSFAVGEGTGGNAPSSGTGSSGGGGGSPGSGGAGGAGSGGNPGGSSGAGAGGAGAGIGADGSANPSSPKVICDYVKQADALYNCQQSRKSYLEKERDELELMKFQLDELERELEFSNNSAELLVKQELYEQAYDTYLKKRLGHEVASARAGYYRALALEQYGMAFQAQGDGERARQMFENARFACLDAESVSFKDEDSYAARLCAARNALKHATLMGVRDPLLQASQREYKMLAQEIDLLEDKAKRNKFLPVAVEAYAGLVHAEIREGEFGVALAALKQAEQLDAKNPLVKHMRGQYEQAFIAMIAHHYDYSLVDAYDLVYQKLRMDESIGEVARRSGPGKLTSYVDPSFNLLVDEVGREQLKLTDEQAGMAFLSKALLRGKSLQEIREMNDAEFAVLFGVDEERAVTARKMMTKAFANLDLQQYLNGEQRVFVFETGQSYFDAGIRGRLDDSVRVDSSDREIYWKSAGTIADDMFSLEGIAMNLLPFAQLGGKVGLLSNSGKVLVGRTLWQASVQAERISAIGAVWAGAKTAVPALGRPGAAIHGGFAATRTGEILGGFAARHPNTLVALGAVEGALIGIGGTQIVEHYSPGSGIIFGTITGEFSPLAHLVGSASAAARAGIRTTTGNSAVRNYGITMSKPAEKTASYTPLVAPEAGARGMHDTTVFYDGKTGDIVGTSRRTAFDAGGRTIPIIEFNSRDAFAKYTFGVEEAGRGVYKNPDGSLFLPYVKGKELPRVLPDADANALLITGQKEEGLFGAGKGGRAETLMIDAPARDSDIGILSHGLAVTGERVYHAPDMPELQIYVPRAGEKEAGILGATDNAPIVRESQKAIRQQLLTKPHVVRGEYDAAAVLNTPLERIDSADVDESMRIFEEADALESGTLDYSQIPTAQFVKKQALENMVGKKLSTEQQQAIASDVERSIREGWIAEDTFEVRRAAAFDKSLSGDKQKLSIEESFSLAQEFFAKAKTRIEHLPDIAPDALRIVPDAEAKPGSWGYVAHQLKKNNIDLYYSEKLNRDFNYVAYFDGKKEIIVVSFQEILLPEKVVDVVAKHSSLFHEAVHAWFYGKSKDKNLQNFLLTGDIFPSTNPHGLSSIYSMRYSSEEPLAHLYDVARDIRSIYFASHSKSPEEFKVLFKYWLENGRSAFSSSPLRVSSSIDKTINLMVTEAEIARGALEVIKDIRGRSDPNAGFYAQREDTPTTYVIDGKQVTDKGFKPYQKLSFENPQQRESGLALKKYDGSSFIHVEVGHVSSDAMRSTFRASGKLTFKVRDKAFIEAYDALAKDVLANGWNEASLEKFKGLLDSAAVKGQVEDAYAFSRQMREALKPLENEIVHFNEAVESYYDALVLNDHTRAQKIENTLLDTWMRDREEIWSAYKEMRRTSFDMIRERLPRESEKASSLSIQLRNLIKGDHFTEPKFQTLIQRVITLPDFSKKALAVKAAGLESLRFIEEHSLPLGIAPEVLSVSRQQLLDQLAPRYDGLDEYGKGVVDNALKKSVLTLEQAVENAWNRQREALKSKSRSPGDITIPLPSSRDLSGKEIANIQALEALPQNTPEATGLTMPDGSILPASRSDGLLVVHVAPDGTQTIRYSLYDEGTSLSLFTLAERTSPYSSQQLLSEAEVIALAKAIRDEKRTSPVGMTDGDFNIFKKSILNDLRKLNGLVVSQKQAFVHGSSIEGVSSQYSETPGRVFQRDREHDYDVKIVMNERDFAQVDALIRETYKTQHPKMLQKYEKGQSSKGVIHATTLMRLDPSKTFMKDLYDLARDLGVKKIHLSVVKKGSDFDTGSELGF